MAALEQGRFRDAAAVRAALDAQTGREARLTRRRRALHIAIAAAVPLAVAIVSILVSGGDDRARAAVAPLAASLFLLSFWCPIGAVLFRGGLPLRALNLAVVRPDGTRASRHLIFLRSAVAWSPGFLFLVAVGIESAWLGAAALASFGLGALVAIVTPQRGIPDRLVGTWLVPL
jgi:hypothetical protein